MSPFHPEKIAGFIDEICDAAAKQTLPLFRTKLDVSNKLQQSFDPVTEGDRNAERAIRDLITQRFPDHGIVGEEFGIHAEQARYQWIIDPIDGTRAFISGIPVWGTLVGLYDHGKPIAGVMDQPFTRERYVAIDGKSSLKIGSGTVEELTTSSVTKLSEATLMTTDPNLLTAQLDQAYFKVEKAVRLTRYGTDCYAYCLLAAGYVDLVIESGLNVYDIAALIPIIEGAGGLVTNWQGGDASQGGQILAAANPALHAEAMARLKS